MTQNNMITEKQVEDLKMAWTLENQEVSQKLKVVEDLVASGNYTQEELSAALADIRATVESVEPRVSQL
jgi:hypothetical protein